MKTTLFLIAAIAALATGPTQAATRTRTVTGPNGHSATRTVHGAYVPGTRYDRSVTRTGPKGNSATTSRVVTPLPKGRSAEVTGPQGNQWTRNSYQGPLGRVRAGKVTGPNGNSRGYFRVR